MPKQPYDNGLIMVMVLFVVFMLIQMIGGEQSMREAILVGGLIIGLAICYIGLIINHYIPEKSYNAHENLELLVAGIGLLVLSVIVYFVMSFDIATTYTSSTDEIFYAYIISALLIAGSFVLAAHTVFSPLQTYLEL